MKKKGSALVTILIVCTALIILATAISVGVINTAKLNKRYSDDIDLELAAKSGLNIFQEELINAIESVNDSSKLPNAVEEVDSGINSFDNITILKEIQKETIENGGAVTGYKYTVISTAKYKSIENSISKIESQVITVNLKNNGSNGGNDGDIGDIIIEPVNFLNIKNTINIQKIVGNTQKEDLIKKVATGGDVSLFGRSLNLEKNNYLKNLNLSLNTDEIEKAIKINNDIDINIDTNIPRDVNLITNQKSINLSDTNINIVDEVIRIDSIDINHDLSINFKNSVVFINGRINGWVNSNLKLELDNSILIIRDDIYTSDKLYINLINNSEIYTTKISSGKQLNIEVNKGKIIATNDFIESRNDKIYIKISNDSILYGNKISANQELNIECDKSKIVTRNDSIESRNDKIYIKISNDSILYGNKISANQELNVQCDKSKIVTKNDSIESVKNKVYIKISNYGSIYSANRLYGFEAVDIIMDKSTINIKNDIYSQKSINLNIKNKSIIKLKMSLNGRDGVDIFIENSKLAVEESDIKSTDGQVSIEAKSRSDIFIGEKLYSPIMVDIKLEKSNIIIGSNLNILGTSEALNNNKIQINSVNGTFVINGDINLNGGLQATLENSAMICIGKFNLNATSELRNLDKSYILVCGYSSHIDNLNLESKTNSITPDSKNVINTLDKYLKK